MSDVRGRLKKLEREATAARSGERPNVFDQVLRLLLEDITLDDVDPEDRSIVERLYYSQMGGGPAAADMKSPQESTALP